MKREELADLSVFMVVGQEGSFTRAASRLGVSQSAVSHTIRRLEEAIGVKLLNRSTRRVTLTDSGEKLLATVVPSLRQIEGRIEELRHLKDAPRGLVRITTSTTAAKTLLWPVISQIQRDYPEIQIEISTDPRLSDLAEDRFDAGVRLGEHLGADMIAVKIGPQLEMAAVASPGYLRARGIPVHPSDLDEHSCIVMRYSAHGAVYDWEFEKDGKEIVKKVSGPFIFNDSEMCIEAAKQGHGIAFITEPEVTNEIRDGSLRRILVDWCPPFDGFHLFYSGRRQVSSALRLLIDRLKFRD